MRRRTADVCIGFVLVVAVGVVDVVPHLPSSPVSDAASAAAPHPTESPSTTTTTLDPLEDRIASALALVASREGDTSFSLIDLATGDRFDEPSPQTDLRSASIIKVAIAIAVLRMDPAPSDEHLSLLTAMIEQSDNDAASELYDEVGGPDAMQALFDELGMNDTVASSDSSDWGFTTTTAGDLATLFAAVASGDALDPASTNLLLSLMSNVTLSQAWGIEDAVPDGTPVALKNGWYPDTDDPVWRVNCGAIIGEPSSGVVLTVTTRYPQSLGIAYGQDTCRSIAAALLAT